MANPVDNPLLSTEEIGFACGRSADWARRKAAAGEFGPVVQDNPRGRVYAHASGVQSYLNQRVQRQVTAEQARIEATATSGFWRWKADKDRRQRQAS